MLRSITIAAAAALLLTACTDPQEPIDIIGTGVVRGLIYVDRDGNEQLTPNFDVAATGAIAALVREGSGDTVATATAGTDGTFILREVDVGQYKLLAGRGILGDSLEIQNVDTVDVKIARGDTLTRVIRLGFPSVSIAAARLLPLNRRVIVRGVALGPVGPDSTLNIQDPSGSLRITRALLAGPLQEGDSVRAVGVIGNSNGRPILDLGLITVVAGARPLPLPDSVSTARAATADGGRLADARVRIARAEVKDTATLAQFIRVGVDDGSGRVEILYRRDATFLGIPPAAYQIGGIVDIENGVLVAGPTGAWQIRPRSFSDIKAFFPTTTIATVRTLEPGKPVQVVGIALNKFGVFGDSTIHIQDQTGAIRAIRVSRFANAIPNERDSLRILGTTARTDGHPVIADAIVTVVAFSVRSLTPDSVSTATAASAGNGARADSHVRIANANIQKTDTVTDGLVLTVDDGSGPVEVHLVMRNIAFTAGQQYVPGGKFSGGGLLVPAPGGAKWRIKPRSAAESSVTFQTLTIAAVRALAVGTATFVDGIALNASTAFGDSTVHLYDNTGTIRAIRVRSVVNSGDSVRFNGTRDSQNGQPVLTGVSSIVLKAGVGVPRADSISLARVATADGGAKDAALVRTSGLVIGVEPLPNGDAIVTLQDSSGTAEVFFDRSVGSPPPGVTNTQMTVTGLLVRSSETGPWRIYPRNGTSDEVLIVNREVTISQARELQIGERVFIRGVALNSLQAFGDLTLHVRGSDGAAIRIIDLPATVNITTGDSVRILGNRATRGGQPVLIGASSTILRTNVGLPRPDSMSTSEAAAAKGGTRDANAVAISGTITAVDSTTTGPGLDRTFTVNDGTGPIKVVIDRDLDLLTSGYIKTVFVRVRGVLIPDGTGWLMKPRSAADIAVSAAPAPPEGGLRAGGGAQPPPN